MKLFISKIVFFLLVFTSLAAISAGSPIFQRWRSRTFQKLILGEENLGPWATGLLQFAQAPGPAYRAPPDTLVLAAKRTNRPDILRGFKRYRGGWDISNKHYWAEVVHIVHKKEKKRRHSGSTTADDPFMIIPTNVGDGPGPFVLLTT